MLHRLLLIIVFAPLAIVLIVLAVANRDFVPFTVDPFHPGNPPFTIELPLFVYLFAAVILGLVIGGVVTWLRQGRHRRSARRNAEELRRMKEETARDKAAAAGAGAPAVIR